MKKNIPNRPNKCPFCGSNHIVSQDPQWRCKSCRSAWQKDGEEQLKKSEWRKKPIIQPSRMIESIDIEKRMIVLFDAHLEPGTQNHPAFEIALAITKDLNPDMIVFGGDWMEMASLSAWDRRRNLLMEGRRYDLELEQGKREIDQLRKKCPQSKMIFFEGNHEFRCTRYVEEHSEMKGKLDIQKDLDLENLGVRWVPFNEVVKIGKLNILHGMFYNIYFARSTLSAIGESCLFGHSHKSQTYTQRLHNDKTPNIAQGVGCLCTTDPQWKRGTPTNFVNSFAVVEYQAGGFFNTYEIFVINNAASYGGHTWKT